MRDGNSWKTHPRFTQVPLAVLRSVVEPGRQHAQMVAGPVPLGRHICVVESVVETEYVSDGSKTILKRLFEFPIQKEGYF